MKVLNKIDNEPGHCILEACNKFIRKLTDYLFEILDEGNASLVNGTLFTAPKENSTLINCFGLMYIDFDKYPPCSGTISKNVETSINAHIQCDHGYPYS